MKRLTSFSVLVFLFASLSCSSHKRTEVIDATPPDNWRSVVTGDYSLFFPKDWEMQSNIAGAVLCILEPANSHNASFRANANLVVENLQLTLSPDKYADAVSKQLVKKYKTASTVICSTNDGRTLHQNRFTDNAGFTIKQNYFVKNKKMYILTFTYPPDAGEALIYTGDKIINCFSIK